jgi:excinuclease ABC subunit C
MTLLETIKQLPHAPGIYQYFDENGRVLYIGKAKNLSKRVKSYFSFTPPLHANPRGSQRIKKMISEAVSLNYIVVKTEHDALILENSLIKQLKPKYNILLRDDKTYPYIYIDKSEKYPRFEITRKIINANDIVYFGPYSVGARDILDSIYEVCKLVQKKGCLKSKKLCLYHQINKCLGPCELDVPHAKYDAEVQKAYELINNKKHLIELLEAKMLFYAEEMRFEEAGELRDRIEKISRSQIKSNIDFASKENYDIFVIQNDENRAVILRMFMRHGKIISSSYDYIPIKDSYDEDELYVRTLLEFYGSEKPPIIAPILLHKKFEGLEAIEQHLSELFEKKAQLKTPKIGQKRHLIDLALLNAKELLKKQTNNSETKTLRELQELCSLQNMPYRIEVFDNSHMSGEASVGAMVVYENNKFDKNSYRKYHLKARDEYAQMRETLTRRIERFTKSSPPDLWVLDGGATLLNLACELLDSAGVFIDVIAISKEKVDAKAHRAKGSAKDIIYTKDNQFRLATNDKRLQFVQRLRDEAHRSAISFHKKTKAKKDQESQLLNLHGISHAKIQKLIQHFGTFEAIKSASLDDLHAVLSLKDAKVIQNLYK